jgi:hypothetical protein
VSGSGSVTVYGGYASLGGILYSFANGPNSSKTYTAGDTTWHLGSLPSVPSSNSDVIVTVYVVADNNTGVANVKHHFGTPVVTSTGTPLTSDSFLSQPQGSGAGVKNEEATVLAVLRYTMTGGAANVTASLNTPTVSDKRCLLSNSPMYLTPLTSGATGGYASGESIDHANRSLDTMNSVVGGTQSGAFNASPLGAIWQSHSPDGHAVLYYSARRDQGGSPARNTWRLAPNEVKTITTGSNQTTTFDGPNIWVITTTGNITLTPNNAFPHSHTIRVYHPSGSHTLHFDPSGLNYDVAAGKSVTFGYNGSAWSVIGLSGAGVGTVTSIATSAPITGGTITTTGTIGISAATTGAAGSMSAADKTKLDGIEANADVTDTTNVTAAGALMDSELTDLAGVKGVTISTLQVKPSEGAFANGDKTKLDGIEANADVTDATNVTAAGALMDSEVTNLADVKAFDPADYATAAQGTTANNALPKAGGTMSGNITMAGSQTVDGRDLSVDGAKLDGIEASADVTDTANVTAAGALMDSEVTNLAQVKAFNSADYATAAQGAKADSALQTNELVRYGLTADKSLSSGARYTFTSADFTEYAGDANVVTFSGTSITLKGAGIFEVNLYAYFVAGTANSNLEFDLSIGDSTQTNRYAYYRNLINLNHVVRMSQFTTATIKTTGDTVINLSAYIVWTGSSPVLAFTGPADPYSNNVPQHTAFTIRKVA